MKRYIFLTMMISLLWSCQSGPDMPMETLAVDHSAIICEPSGAEYSISVTSNTGWEIVSKDISWISTNMTKTTGNADFILTVLPNSDDEPRSATVVIRSSTNIRFSREIQIQQSGKSETGYVRISALRAMEEQGKSVTLASSAKVKGYVVTNAVSSNYYDHSMAIEDSFSEPSSGISIAMPESSTAVEQGCEAVADLSGATLGRNADGILVLTPKTVPEKTEATKINLKPIPLTYSQLSSGEYESMYVSLQLQVVEESIGGTMNSSPLLEDASGNNVRMVVSDQAAFSTIAYQEGVGTVCGIAGSKSAVPQLRPTVSSDAAFTTSRMGVEPGIRKLPYILSLYANTQTNKDLKYSTVTEDGSFSKLGTDFFVKDRDAKSGAYLTARCSDLMTSSGQFRMTHWAEQAAHDNIPGKSFTSDNGSGYYFVAPIQMDGFPHTFHLAFAIGATGGCLRNWVISYSDDNLNWIDGARIIIPKPMDSGGWIYYYDVVLNTTIDYAKGSTLYIRWCPTGTANVKDGVTFTTGLSSDCRFCCCCAIFTDYSAKTDKPSDAVYFEPFDQLTGGMDYLWGDRLAAMMNFCGNDISAWTDVQKDGMTGQNVRQRRGYAQIGYVESQEVARDGYTNKLGYLTTPKLGTAGNLNLSFDAMAYMTPSARALGNASEPADKKGDLKSIVIKVIGGGTINGATSAAVSGLSTSEFNKYSLTISGATADTQLQFTSAPASGDFSRWFIDNILVTK